MIRINNRKAFLLEEIPVIHPASSAYLKFWREQKRRSIEGFWGQDSVEKTNGMWRWMPPQLYFYANFAIILHQDEDGPVSAPKMKIRPLLRDVEWEVLYSWIEARGFSGFEEDEQYSCCRLLMEEGVDVILPKSCYNKNGELKEYVPAREYLRKLHNKPLGLPIYDNQAKNLIIMGSRGFGKSFLAANAIILHEWIFDGAKKYDKQSIEHPYTVSIFVGAASSSKSSETLSKLKDCYDNMPGAYGVGSEKECPHPWHKQIAGDLKPNNFQSPWRHEYKKRVGGKWKTMGSQSKINHGIYTVANPEAAAGTRPIIAIIEEVGLLPNTLQVHGSNDAAQKEGAIKFGSALYIGTGGNIKKVAETKMIFYNPNGFDFLAFEDEWEHKGEIGLFIPAYYAFNQFKDENGNTNVEQAMDYITRRRKEKLESNAPFALEYEMMNYPIVPSEMFLNIGITKFPVADILERLGLIETDKHLLEASWKVEFIQDESGYIDYKLSDKKVIRDFPVRTGLNFDAAIEIFEWPKKDNKNQIPYGRYIAAIDPVDDDGNTDITTSLQSTLILDTWTNKIVAEYTARTPLAEQYYEQVRRMLIYFNATVNYENQKKGFFGYMKNMHSLYLLCPTPDILKDKRLIKKINRFGNTSYGTATNDHINEWADTLIVSWLAEEIVDDIKVLNTIRSIGLLKELSMFDGDINCDRISALRMLMIYKEDVRPKLSKQLNTIGQQGNSGFWNKNFENYQVRNNGIIIKKDGRSSDRGWHVWDAISSAKDTNK